MLKVKKKKTFRVEGQYKETIDDVEKVVPLWVDMKFKHAEDVNYRELVSKMENKGTMLVKTKEKIVEDGVETEVETEKEIEGGSYNALLYSIRSSIVAWCDEFVDEDGSVLEFNDENQIAVFDILKEVDPSMFERMLAIYSGTTEKN